MFLTSLTHRDRLFDISASWLEGSVHGRDAEFVTAAFLLESAITGPSITRLLDASLASAGAGPPRVHHLRTKAQVRDCIMRSWKSPSRRARMLFEEYERAPAAFFPKTPVAMIVTTKPDGRLVSMIRYKNLFRVADKVARRAARRLREDVLLDLSRRQNVEAVESALANVTGFDAALAEVSEAFLCGESTFTREDLRVDDAIGAKLVLPECEFEAVERRLASHPDVLSLRRSEHHGIYNDVHLLVEVRCPPKGPTIERLKSMDWSWAPRRGLPRQRLLGAIPEYVETGAGTFFFEILLTTLPELVEAEFGRGLHENRIVRQRLDPIWNGRIATNVLLTSLSMLVLALAPRASVDHLPVRISGRYLPETALVILAEFFGLDVPCTPLWGAGAGAQGALARDGRAIAPPEIFDEYGWSRERVSV
ncbi:MAG: hypothetical protein HC882_01095 [Acidobacteria bacterium]|nr:hypothetical protein [Acidobacteriota bacterium]